LNYNRSLLFHGGDTGSIPVRDANNSSAFLRDMLTSCHRSVSWRTFFWKRRGVYRTEKTYESLLHRDTYGNLCGGYDGRFGLFRLAVHRPELWR